MALGVDSASDRNEYQEHFRGVKDAGAQGWQPYHHPVPLSCNLGTLTSWNPLGHSRPVMGMIYLYLYLFNVIGLPYSYLALEYQWLCCHLWSLYSRPVFLTTSTEGNRVETTASLCLVAGKLSFLVLSGVPRYSKEHCCVWRFPGFSRLSFWYEQY